MPLKSGDWSHLRRMREAEQLEKKPKAGPIIFAYD
jgi:hypothetical protein